LNPEVGTSNRSQTTTFTPVLATSRFASGFSPGIV
jgi:hypothetical protein